MKKINSINFGGPWIIIGIILGLLLPLVIYLIFDVFLWWLCAIGALVLLAFGVVFTIEMHQDNSKIPYYERELKNNIPFDPDKQYAVIRSSICTGEKVAGFKNFSDKHFTEVMIIRNDYDKERFMAIYDLKEIKTEY